MSPRARTVAARVLLVAGLLSALVGLATGYLRREVFDAQRFGDNAVEVVRDDAVRRDLSRTIAASLANRNPRLIAVQPVLESAASDVLGGRFAGGIVSRAAVQVHNALFSSDKGSIVIDLANLAIVAKSFLRATNPGLADQLDRSGGTVVVELADRTLTTRLVRTAKAVSFVGVAAPLAALACFAAALWLAPRRRRTALGIGAGLIGVGALGFVLSVVVRSLALAGTSGPRRDVTRAVLDAYLGSFPLWCLLVGLAGLLLAGSAAALIGTVDPSEVPRRAWALAAREPHRPAAALGRAAALIVLGALIIADPGAAVALAAVVAGAYLAFAGLAALLTVIVGSSPLPEEFPTARAMRRRALPVVLGTVAVAGVACVAVVLALGAGGAGPAAAVTPAVTGPGCNGHVELCGRRLDEVVFAATHNSMSVPSAGFLNANNDLPLARQLDIGVRGFLIDALEGQRNEDGVVRTNLVGKSRETVVAQIGEEGLAAAQRLAGSVVFGPIEGDKQLYLCHVLCELGATKAVDDLRVFKDWLDANPREVLVFFVQDEAPAAVVKAAFEESGLAAMASEYRPGTPFPTLAAMIESGQRVFVMAENDGEPTGWYHQGFVLTQDTPFDFGTVAELEAPDSCRPNRGLPTSPLFLVNHWVETYPPNPRNADVVNQEQVLLDRARRCQRERKRVANLLAVDFVGRGDLIPAVDVLNGVD